MFQLIRTEYTKTSSKLKYAGKEIVFVEKHKKCKCDCKVQKKVYSLVTKLFSTNYITNYFRIVAGCRYLEKLNADVSVVT